VREDLPAAFKLSKLL